ncbi:hypothetical protein EDF31_101552 [Curtobacterium sp. PhB142]|jgi:hypothetical protein|nr:hypothetical protein EDF55_1568 [Curtobacterium sp. ZW137]ROQ04980.1 hypothetical protein EDF41_3099 [Curtobacterium sp. PhB171]ROQ22181.1 hypothetical protein EDF40_3267 [Curtobacterium sp. PhB170]ROS33541.1 hypothetical protein EDF25_2922 [Curtobacterium sp. PhB131]ROS36409.1 hypothetical protein EDF53_2377 [Curtobacterium sp. PhB78]ROS64860.1 hypothetical protein EDF30_3275 [Curtobacterium sp. PhB141]ROS65144.1 hypothetical protein EDF42_1565 [Curtobacterium sp. PhB172]RPE83249.1 hypot
MRPNQRSGGPLNGTARSRCYVATDAFDMHDQAVADVVTEAEQVVQSHATTRVRHRQPASAAGLMPAPVRA